MEENDFLRAVLADPKDNALLLVYSDWLEEQGDPASASKAEFLRVTVEQVRDKGRKGGKKARRNRLQELAATLDTGWLAVVSRLQLENCPKKRSEGEARLSGPVRFEFVCDKRWEDLRITDEHAVRYCDACAQSVHYCDTITDARRHALNGHCVAVDLGVIRRDGDVRVYDDLLSGAMMGRPSPSQQRRELLAPDPVSAERERRKREAGEMKA